MQSIKVETEKGHEIVKRMILSQIEDGTLQPGQRLPSVVDLAAAYGVGRSTIREALSALKATGWIDVKHGGGTFVSKLLPTVHSDAKDPFADADDLKELLEVRIYLESGAAASAAKRRTEQDLAALKQIVTVMELALEQDDTARSEKADIDFHLAIASASHNQLLNELMQSLTSKLTETIGKSRQLWFFEDKSSASQLLKEHQSIYEAIATQDAERAGQLISAHLHKVDMVLKRGGRYDGTGQAE
ncbi:MULTISPECIES: FadR/GntR family transcriptional regulator [Paenibacillus]|uniref:GntR family transcriptional regulator n=1 Tax=Paenibacillus campinasensis TaxID=66347 RepID=A0A268EU21_9BACL|nr:MULTISPECIES: FadR/GntR family transcriptional regulator [Paenibacillus]PAD76628.1 GntR family transcriptional regulator [Paenibacillus campinasensis]PAK55587.1 GntR family transcriptional regulator [Paenibacillus sp. 7541]